MMLQLSSFILMSLSFVGATVALWCLFHVRRLLADVSARSLSTLRAEVAELTFVCESLQAQQKRLSARVGMREARQRKEENEDGAPVGTLIAEKPLPREQLREIARARGHKVS